MDKKTKRTLKKGALLSAGLKSHSITTTLSALGKSGTEVSEQDMSGMFYGSKVTDLDLSNYDTSNVTNMSGMFACIKATDLDLSSFDTSNETDMSKDVVEGPANNQDSLDKHTESDE